MSMAKRNSRKKLSAELMLQPEPGEGGIGTNETGNDIDMEMDRDDSVLHRNEGELTKGGTAAAGLERGAATSGNKRSRDNADGGKEKNGSDEVEAGCENEEMEQASGTAADRAKAMIYKWAGDKSGMLFENPLEAAGVGKIVEREHLVVFQLSAWSSRQS